MIERCGRVVVGGLCAALIVLGGGSSAQASAPEPDYLFSFSGGSGFEGPCGVGVDSKNNPYVSDYYRNAVYVFDVDENPPLPTYYTQISNVDPLDGPCGLAIDNAGNVYVNNYHRNVEKYTPAVFPPKRGTAYGPPTVFDSSHPTGVAVEPIGGNVYVNARTYIAAYDSDGAPILDGGEPLRIGLGSLEDGYGLALSRFSATAGRLYVADAADNTVKAYDPALSLTDPVATIAGPGAGREFVSLRDSALAVDRLNGDLYVADNLQPAYAERPQAAIHVFDAAGGHKGRLKYNIVDPLPPGLAVDGQSRVYVTSGNTVGGVLYRYPPGSATSVSAPPLDPQGLEDGESPAAGGASPAGMAVAEPAGPPAPQPGATASEIVQRGKLRVTVRGGLAPRRLPRKGLAPIAVTVGGEISTSDGSDPPRLRTLRIELNRNGRLRYAGLPTCPYKRIQPASSARALTACRPALVGKGSFTADIALAGQEAYPTRGRLLAFNGVRGGKPVLFGQIYSARPFATSFVIVFAIERLRRGAYGTALDANLPKTLGTWGNLTGIKLTLSRRYSHKGRRRSYVSAGCPAPKGFPGAIFPLARTTFGFAGERSLRSVLSGHCKVRGS